ncbi:hypothetical protein [Paenibacillus sp.]|jgi:hypothetical protein|uniref:hypothetical protein n=1 Tax=Paenibacillus sp. TaxID=58172 RepID=UPI00281D891B|nr:hypothetical protein [Paenibacillus sp.]MDR0269178.1 hypothetical protein [Paenibacillus sp.]
MDLAEELQKQNQFIEAYVLDDLEDEEIRSEALKAYYKGLGYDFGDEECDEEESFVFPEFPED